MVDRQAHIQDLTGRRLGWEKVVVRINLQGTHSDVVARLIQLARQRRWQLVSLAKFLDKLPENLSVRGAIVDSLASHPRVRAMLDRGIAAVRIGQWPNDDDHRVPAVVPDMPAAGMAAAEYLARRDFKHVAFVGREPWGVSQPLYDAFAARAAELGCACHLLRVPHSDASEHNANDTSIASRWARRQAEFTELLRPLPRPLGMLAIGDRQADRYSFWATEAGLRVPEDVAIMGIGNEEFVCEAASPPLTSVALDYDRITRAAVELLGQLLAGKKPDQTTVFIPPLSIVTRQSTDVLAASDPLVATALRFMWDHVTEDLSVERIAEYVGVSRRTLEIAFQRDIGRGINSEFQRRRLEKVKELLAQTDIPIAQIAQSMNFSSAGQLSRVFRAAFGVRPSQFRRQHGSTA